MRAPPAFKYVLLGFAAGAAVSILFFPLNFLLALVLLSLLLTRLFRRAPSERVGPWIAGGVALVTVAVAIVLPVKQLDGRVGPFLYGRMSLDELCPALGRDHRVFVSADRGTVTNMVDSFATEREMSRREVLKRGQTGGWFPGLTFSARSSPCADDAYAANRASRMKCTAPTPTSGLTPFLESASLEDYGISGIPHAFVMDRGGKIIWHGSPSSPEMDSVISGALKKKRLGSRPMHDRSRTLMDVKNSKPNQWLQATLDRTSLFFLVRWPGAPEPRR